MVAKGNAGARAARLVATLGASREAVERVEHAGRVEHAEDTGNTRDRALIRRLESGESVANAPNANAPNAGTEAHALDGWMILVQPALRLAGEELVPDLAGWRRDRIAKHGGDARELAPDWTCDFLLEPNVVSTGSTNGAANTGNTGNTESAGRTSATSDVARTVRAVHHERNVPAYAREGVRHVWLIDHGARRLEGLRLHGASYVSAGAWENDARIQAEPFDAELDLSVLWAP